jgi:hypothetical protein
MSLPVVGFLPRRFFLCFTQNLPKLEIKMSPPDLKDSLISSGKISTVSIDFLRVYSFLLYHSLDNVGFGEGAG